VSNCADLAHIDPVRPSGRPAAGFVSISAKSRDVAIDN